MNPATAIIVSMIGFALIGIALVIYDTLTRHKSKKQHPSK